jgi:hypothetical protein
MKKNIILFVTVLFLGACIHDPAKQVNEKKADNVHEVLVQEVVHAGGYTYLRVTGDNGENWLAVPKMEAKPGDIFYHADGMPMKNFKSKELSKTFPLVWFLDKVYENPKDAAKPVMPKNHSTGSKVSVNKAEITIEKIEGGITIEELYANKEKYRGKDVKIKGKVTKFNANIMNTNWIHLQDGTEYDGKFDLVVTSKAKFKVGDIVTVSGKVTLNKDFGHGYFYEVIIEGVNSEMAKMFR